MLDRLCAFLWTASRHATKFLLPQRLRCRRSTVSSGPKSYQMESRRSIGHPRPFLNAASSTGGVVIMGGQALCDPDGRYIRVTDVRVAHVRL